MHLSDFLYLRLEIVDNVESLKMKKGYLQHFYYTELRCIDKDN